MSVIIIILIFVLVTGVFYIQKRTSGWKALFIISCFIFLIGGAAKEVSREELPESKRFSLIQINGTSYVRDSSKNSDGCESIYELKEGQKVKFYKSTSFFGLKLEKWEVIK